MKQNIPLIFGAIDIKNKKIRSYREREKVIYAFKNISEAITNAIILGDIMQAAKDSLQDILLQVFADAQEIIPSLEAAVSMTYDVMLEILKKNIRSINAEAARLYAELLQDTKNEKKMETITAGMLEEFFKKRIAYYMEISAMYVSNLEFASIVDDILNYENIRKTLKEREQDNRKTSTDTIAIKEDTDKSKNKETDKSKDKNKDKNKDKDEETNRNKDTDKNKTQKEYEKLDNKKEKKEDNINKNKKEEVLENTKSFYSKIDKKLYNKIVSFLEPYSEEFIENLGNQEKLYESKNKPFYIGTVDKIVLKIITDNAGVIGKKQEERIKKFIEEQKKIIEKTQKEIQKAKKMGVSVEKYRELKKLEEEETSFIGDVVQNIMTFLRDKVGIKPPGFFKPLDFVFDRLVLNPMLKRFGTSKDIKRIKRFRQILGYDTKHLERAERYVKAKEDYYRRENNRCYSEMIKNLFGSEIPFDQLTEEQKSHIKILCYMKGQFQKYYKKDETLEMIKSMQEKKLDEQQQNQKNQQTQQKDTEKKKSDKLKEGLNKINTKNRKTSKDINKNKEEQSSKKSNFELAKKLNRKNIFLEK